MQHIKKRKKEKIKSHIFISHYYIYLLIRTITIMNDIGAQVIKICLNFEAKSLLLFLLLSLI